MGRRQRERLDEVVFDCANTWVPGNTDGGDMHAGKTPRDSHHCIRVFRRKEKMTLLSRNRRPAVVSIFPNEQVTEQQSALFVKKENCSLWEAGNARKEMRSAARIQREGLPRMQWNPGVRTIEHDLIKALSDANAVPEHAKGNPGKARVTEEGDQGFTSNGHQACSARSYEYVLPTFAFAPFHCENGGVFKKSGEYVVKGCVLVDTSSPGHTAGLQDYRPVGGQDQRVPPQYEGTHNFHNFTSGKEATETSAKRYIMSFKCGNRFVASAECDECPQKKEVEFISLHVQGQSFMIHQIRKMIGLLIAIVKGYIPEGSITRAYTMERAEIPKAPGIGLLLDNASGQQDFPFPSLLSSSSCLPFSPLPSSLYLGPFILQVHFELYNKRFADNGIHPVYAHLLAQYVFSFLHASTLHPFHPSLLPIDPSSLPCDDLDLSHSMMHWLSSLLKHDFTYYLKPEQSQTPAPESQMQQSQATVSCDMQESQASVSCDMQSQASVSCDMQESQATVSCDNAKPSFCCVM
eukprot:Em0003g383a